MDENIPHVILIWQCMQPFSPNFIRFIISHTHLVACNGPSLLRVGWFYADTDVGGLFDTLLEPT